MAALYLLKVPQHVDPAVEDALPLGRVQPVDEICRVVFVAFFIPVRTETTINSVKTPMDNVSNIYSVISSIHVSI